MWTEGERYSGAWNFAPTRESITVRELVNCLIYEWGSGSYTDLSEGLEQQQEAKTLRLDSYKAFSQLDWEAVLKIVEAVKYTVDWYKHPNPDYDLCVKQINDYDNETRQIED